MNQQANIAHSPETAESPSRERGLCAAIVFVLGAAGLCLWLVRLVAFSALTVLLFLQGPEWVREGGFCARAAAAIGLAIGWECAWGLLLPSARRSPDDGRSGSSSFSHSIDKLLGGVIAAISWEIVLNLSVRGVVASTFGIVAAFAGAELLLTAASFVIITALVFALA